MDISIIDKYFSIVVKEGLYSSGENLERYLNFLFHSISFTDKTMLEIGGGAGLLSLYAASRGAKSVICLEPELAGSKKNVSNKFEYIKKELSIDNAFLQHITFQEYVADRKFDIILSQHSINHLDEDACANLKKSDKALNAYLSIFRKMAEMSVHGADLIIIDCSRYNLFNLLGIKNPLTPTIEWHKHQSPWFWAKMLGSVGFCKPQIRWRQYNKLGIIGKRVLSNVLISHCLTSSFFLNMKKC